MDKIPKNHKISVLYDFYKNSLTEKQREALEMYHNEDLSLAEIKEHVGISRQGVRDHIKRGEETLIKLEEEIGFADFYYETQENLLDIESVLHKLSEHNEFYLKSPEVLTAIEDITKIIKNIK